MTEQIIIGNIIAFLASIVMVYTGYIKDKKKILYAQTIQIALFVVSNLVLGGIAGAIVNAINAIRNILCYKDKLNTPAKIIIILVGTICTIAFNKMGAVGYLPIAITIVYILFMNTKDVIMFKNLMILTLLGWFVYDLCLKSYSSAAFDGLTIITIMFSIMQLEREKKNKKNKKDNKNKVKQKKNN